MARIADGWFSIAGIILGLILGSLSGCKLPTSTEVGLPVIGYFRATPSRITVGEISTLSWNVYVAGLPGIPEGSTLTVVIHFEIGIPEGITVERVGTLEVNPKETTVHKLTASAAGNSVSKSVTVEVMGYGR